MSSYSPCNPTPIAISRPPTSMIEGKPSNNALNLPVTPLACARAVTVRMRRR
jgi:hypothetical protein